MLRRLLSLVLVLSLLCVEVPAALCEAVIAVQEAAQDEPGRYRLLVRGDRDGDDSVDIVALQNRLIELGYLRDAADGVFGGNTVDAVSAFQRSNGLEDTGSASPELQELIFSGAELVSASTSTDPESVTYRTQEKLVLWGFLADSPDGKSGSKTQEAVAAFKEYMRGYNKLYPTPSPVPVPTPDPSTISGFGDAAIAVDMPIDKSRDTEITQDVLDYVDGKYEFRVYRKTLSNGDRGDEVLRLQRRLHQLKYLAIADGAFGPTTERALLYFQKKHGLSQNAVADEATQRMLFSADATAAEEFVNEYKIVVDVSDQKVYVYQWNGSDYSTLMGEMICSTGEKETPTPLGIYQAAGPTNTGEWYWFDDYEVYAKWATRIVGGILFHSVVYSKGKVMNKTSLKKLGRPASHGCIRLKVEHAQWIYENCHTGTTVIVQE